MKQTRTSAMTSINSKKLPTLYTKQGIRGNVLDWGCGRYTEHIEAAVNAAGFKWFGYDPYNQSKAHNDAVLDAVLSGTENVDYIYCSNVLNVIDEDDAVRGLAFRLLTIARYHGAPIIITVYEGDKSGIGKESKPDCYQRNERLNAYTRFFEDARRITIKNGCMLIEA